MKRLYANSNQFMQMADSYFSNYVREARKDLDQKGQEIKGTVDPVRHSLERYETKLSQMEKERERAFGSITAQLSEMGRAQNLLQLETANLVKALRVPHVRGRWGEITLKRVAELAGMTDHCDFFEQLATGSRKGALRPDMVVALPEGRKIVVDSKVPLMAYLDALEAREDSERQTRMLHHGRQVLQHITDLSSKNYRAQFTPTPEFVVLFIPGENFFSAALSVVPDLIEKGVEKGVVLATPTTLIALLKAVDYSWQQQKSYENAEEIRQLGKELFDRLLSVTGHINQLGKDIGKCTTDYNRLVGTVKTRLVPTARKMQSLGVSSSTIKEPETVDIHANPVRQLDTEKTDEP